MTGWVIVTQTPTPGSLKTLDREQAFWLLSALVAGLFAFRLYLNHQSTRWKRQLPAAKAAGDSGRGPTTPISLLFGGGFQHSRAFHQDPVNFLRRARSHNGKWFYVPSPLMDVVWMLDAKDNKLFLEKKEEEWSFADGMGFFLRKIVVPGYLRQLPAFVSSVHRGINRPTALAHWSNLVSQETEKWLKEQLEYQSSHGKCNELFHSISLLVHRVIVRCLMGEDFYDYSDELFEALHDMERDIGDPLNVLLPDWIPHPSARRLAGARDRVCVIFDKCLSAREQDPDRWKDSLDYIQFTLDSPDTRKLKRFYAAHHTLLMFAAHTSTVSLIAWTLVELLNHPQELEDTQFMTSTLNKLQDWPKHTLLQACLSETGRRRSSTSMLRYARKPVTLPGDGRKETVTLPRGSVVMISPYLTHNEEAHYERANTWDPQRWIQNPRLANQLNSGGEVKFMQFGWASHRCPGEKMAKMMAAITILTILDRANPVWFSNAEIKDASEFDKLENLDFTKIGSAWSKKPVEVWFEPRSDHTPTFVGTS